MSEIKVKIDECDQAITQLQSLKFSCVARKVTAPTTVGGGKSVNEFENIANTYKQLNTHMCNLISNTIGLIQNVRDSYAASDTKAANAIKNK